MTQPFKLKLILSATFVLLLALLLVGCGDATTTNTNAATTNSATGGTTPAGTSVDTSKLSGTIRLGFFPNLTHPQALVGIGDGSFAKALGSNVKLTTTPFNAGPAATEALLAGQIDITYIGPNPAINAYVKTKGGVKVIAGAASGGVSFVVRSDENINTPQDLAGKKLATPQLGNTQDVALRSYLKQNGLAAKEQGGNVEVIPTDNANILQLFQNKQIDGAWVPEPWATRLVQDYKGKVFLDESSLWPNGQFVITHLLVSSKFLKEHPDLVKAFLAAHVDVTQNIQKNPDAAAKVLNDQLKALGGSALPEPVLKESFGKIQLTLDPLKSSLLKSADSAFGLGFLGKEKPNLDGLYDLTLLNQVLTEKGLPTVPTN